MGKVLEMEEHLQMVLEMEGHLRMVLEMEDHLRMVLEMEEHLRMVLVMQGWWLEMVMLPELELEGLGTHRKVPVVEREGFLGLELVGLEQRQLGMALALVGGGSVETLVTTRRRHRPVASLSSERERKHQQCR
jgi:hypothetical protein